MAVSQAFDRVRSSAGLPALRRIAPSKAEAQLVCTAALTGKEPSWGELETYITDDLSSVSLVLKAEALGKPIARPENGRSSVPFLDREFPRYSVVVELDTSSGPSAPRYRVGITRRLSRWNELIDPTFAEDRDGWKKEVDVQCKTAK